MNTIRPIPSRDKPAPRPGADLERRIAWIAVVTPMVGFVLAVIILWGRGIDVLDLILCLGLGAASLLGITAGYHRLFTHHSYKTTAAVQWALGGLGSMAVQGPLLFWAACHRRHHAHSDRDGDPHSPRPDTDGIASRLESIWHAHVGWMFRHEPESWGRFVPDLLRDDTAFRINVTYPWWVLLGLVLPALIGFAFHGVAGAATGFLWGGLARIFLVQHVTWSINSLCHVVGSRPYDTGDESCNNIVFGLLALGEGWHNNHHAFPSSARHGLQWWQFDFTFMVIRLLSGLGLAWDVKLPPAEMRRSSLETAAMRPASLTSEEKGCSS